MYSLTAPDASSSIRTSAAAAGWCEPEGILGSLFHLTHLPASNQQLSKHADGLCDLFARFVTQLSQARCDQQREDGPTDDGTLQPLWPDLTAEDLAALQKVEATLSSGNVTWYPEYGCALLAMGPVGGGGDCSDGNSNANDDVRHQPDQLSLHIIALDAWDFRTHRPAAIPVIALHTAACSRQSVLCSGTVAAERHGSLLALVSRLAEKRRTDRKEEGVKGFQRTPAFMLSVVSDALKVLSQRNSNRPTAEDDAEDWEGLKDLDPESKPRGGTTDVGQHTGGDTVRDTCWPLVRAAIQVVLEQGGVCISTQQEPSLLFRQAMAHLDLWLLRRQAQLIWDTTATPTVISAAMQIMSSATGKAAALVGEGYDMSAFEEECSYVAQHLQSAAGKRALQAGRALQLPAAGSSALRGSQALPAGTLPAVVAPCGLGDGLEAARQRAERNLGSLPLLQPGASFQEMLALMQQSDWAQPRNDVAAQLALRSVERELFSRAVEGFGLPRNLLVGEEVEALAKLVDAYCASLSGFMQTAASGAAMRVELRSRELLVVWTAYCLFHKAAGHSHPIVLRYGVALSYHDLRHLVLSDRQAVDAGLSVAAYLERHAMPRKDIFALRDGGKATMDMAREFAAGDGSLQLILGADQADAEARKQAHWREVQRKQEEASRLRHELASLKAAGADLDSKRNSHASAYRYGSSTWASTDRGLELAQNSNYNEQNRVTSALKVAEQAPQPVVQPLPQNTDLARTWVFFLHMPPLFRHLSRASFLAQQLLLPRPPSKAVLEAITVNQLDTSLVHLYNSQRAVSTYLSSPTQLQHGSDGAVQLFSYEEVPSISTIGPKHIDHFSTSADGVWYPDTVLPKMAWNSGGAPAGSGGGFPPKFNPFATLDAATVETYFTEDLPTDAKALQWAMHQHGTAAVTPAQRGNFAIAQQDERPSWLSKPAYLELGRLRAYPLQQLRNLCAALHDRTLPLAQPAVQLLLRQLLFHIGTLTTSCAPALLWRTGWEQEGDVLVTLCAELGALTEELEQKPREHEAVLLLGEVAAYLAHWHEPCRAVARRFAAMTSRVADELEAQLVAASGNDSLVAELLAKQCRWRVMALLCYGVGPMDADDAGFMIQLMVLINHGLVFQEDEELLTQLQRLRVRAHNVMASRIAPITQHVAQRPQILTAAMGRVLQGRTPSTLPWVQLTSPTARCSWALGSFEAVGPADMRLYSINVLDGTILFDGWPPSRLPKEVTEHPLYCRTFGDYNFEVAFSGTGVLQTLRAVNGCLYDFSIGGEDGQRLTIVELDRGHGDTRLELLDAGEDEACAGWGEELPVRLRELHSHWLSRDRDVIVLRPHCFQNHEPHFIMKCAAAEPDGVAEYDCRRVQPHLRPRHWTDLLSEFDLELPDRLVLLKGCFTADPILTKFEASAFIHTFINIHTDELSFELPRFGLEFQLPAADGSDSSSDGGGDGPQILSRNYSGYRLHHRQLLVQHGAPGCDVTYTLPEFRQYLVLERVPCSAVVLGVQRADVLVLVPGGQVSSSAYQRGAYGPLVKVEVPQASGAELKAHCYEVHGRFGHLRAASVLARLQLAALYSATSTLLPEPLSRATGAQMAMELLRQCWGVRPLTDAELVQLHSVGPLGGHLAAGLWLLAHDLEASAAQLSHLHLAVSGAAPAAAACERQRMPVLDSDAGTSYLQETQTSSSGRPSSFGSNRRLLLTGTEEERTFGVHRAPDPVPAWKRQRHYKPFHLSQLLLVPADFVVRTEASLRRLVVNSGNQQPDVVAPAPYPLTPSADATPLELGMHADLAASWEAHQSLPTAAHLDVVPGALRSVREAQASTKQHRTAAEEYLLRQLSCVPEDVGCHGASFRLLRLAAAVPIAGPLDLMRVACGRSSLLDFNPFLSPEAVEQLSAEVLRWLQLCVLEDRLGRLEALAVSLEAGEDCLPQLVQELQVHRTWDVRQHPQWLVFEAEGQLQIRPAQYAIARLLLEYPGAIAQLNMGEGKTRVILPMLALQWADGSRVVRLNFLSTLLDEAYAHLHAHLCASVLGRKLFTLPFHRDVRVTVAGTRAMRASLALCKKEGGLLLVAPEHRLSLQLKQQELWASGEERKAEWAALGELTRVPYLDLLDESDELLHHRYQLVYAWGAPIGLPAMLQRTRVLQALLHAASRLAAAGELPLPAEAHVLEPPAGASPGAFCGLRLLPGEGLDATLPALQRQLTEELLADPPYELAWLKAHPLKEQMIGYIMDVSESMADALEPQLPPEQLDVVLALRGLLGCGVLQHGLEKRHQVEYGVARSTARQDEEGRKRTRMAVPFRAAHTPSERSEFAQPEVSLLLSTLSYYYDGLSRTEFRAALMKLLGMGLSAQQDHYDAWLEMSAGGIPPEDLVTVDSVAKVDPSNPQQMELMHRHMSHNMAVVDFWLNLCVFPTETRQFPQRLSASAWHLADGAHVVGFSGTNDNYRLLPLQVHQAQPEEPALVATNGKMLDVIGHHTRGFTTLQPPLAQGGGGRPVWRALLDTALELGLDALMDCGALLAGASNRRVADYLVARLNRHRFRGVTYFDEEMKTWVVVDAHGRRMPRHMSPIAERDTFALFDEARCRGADLKLRLDAVGLLTLGPGVCKDKLMQAAGRLRQLGRGQMLRFAATADVATKVRQHGAPAGQPTAAHVLQWVMSNTVQATLHGVSQWAGQGLQFAATRGASERALHDEVLLLSELYGGSKAPQPVGEFIATKAQNLRRQCYGSQSGLAPAMADLMVDIEQHSALHGTGYEVTAGSGADEECERELEQEEEEEQEVERQVPRVDPAKECDWDYESALTAISVRDRVAGAAKAVALATAAAELQPDSLQGMGWSPQVLCTSNFLQATAGMPTGAALNEYLRPVSWLLLFACGETLALSDREADMLLGLVWARTAPTNRAAGIPHTPILVHLTYARHAISSGSLPLLATSLSSAGSGAGLVVPTEALEQRLAVNALVSLQVFNGETSYDLRAQREELRALVMGRREEVEALVGMRGKLSLLPRSHLEKVCEGMLRGSCGAGGGKEEEMEE